MARRVLQIRSVLLSENFLGMGSLVSSGTQNGVRGPYGVMTELDFLKKIFFSKNGENSSHAQGSLNVYENLVIFFS